MTSRRPRARTLLAVALSAESSSTPGQLHQGQGVGGWPIIVPARDTMMGHCVILDASGDGEATTIRLEWSPAPANASFDA